MSAKANLTCDYVRRLFVFDTERGLLIWNERPASDFRDGKYPAARAAAAWNARYAGTVAGCIVEHGYRYIAIDDRRHMAHRLIWLYVTGSWPERDLDHIEGVDAGDKMDNLRDVTHLENMKNMKLSAKNSSGVSGVSWHKHTNSWRARISLMSKDIYLGIFVDKADAIAARRAAEIKYGYHKNHGQARAALASNSGGGDAQSTAVKP